MKEFIRINDSDNVAVALMPLSKDKTIDLGDIKVTLLQDIPQGHKFALAEIKSGDAIIKYGNQIGIAKEDIPMGSWVHTHNIGTALGELLEYNYNPVHASITGSEERFFDGFRRSDGKVGVRNEIWIVPTVGCMNSVAKEIERSAQHLVGGSLESIFAFNHPYGCSQMGDDQENTREILADLRVEFYSKM